MNNLLALCLEHMSAIPCVKRHAPKIDNHIYIYKTLIIQISDDTTQNIAIIIEY